MIHHFLKKVLCREEMLFDVLLVCVVKGYASYLYCHSLNTGIGDCILDSAACSPMRGSRAQRVGCHNPSL